jgi:hypothetical protein
MMYIFHFSFIDIYDKTEKYLNLYGTILDQIKGHAMVIDRWANFSQCKQK